MEADSTDKGMAVICDLYKLELNLIPVSIEMQRGAPGKNSHRHGECTYSVQRAPIMKNEL